MLKNITHTDIAKVLTEEEFTRLQNLTVLYLADNSFVSFSPDDMKFMRVVVEKMRAAQ